MKRRGIQKLTPVVKDATLGPLDDIEESPQEVSESQPLLESSFPRKPRDIKPPVGIQGESGEVKEETNCYTGKGEVNESEPLVYREKKEKPDSMVSPLSEEMLSAFEKMRDDPDGPNGFNSFTDPKKMKEMTEKMGSMDEKTLRIINDVKSNPEAIQEIQKMARVMGLQDKANSSVAEQRRVLKMQKQMKKTMAAQTTRKSFKCLRVNRLKKVKVITVEMEGDKTMEQAMEYRIEGSNAESTKIGKYVVVYSHSTCGVKDKLIEKYFGTKFGSDIADIIIASATFEVLTEKDFNRVAKEIMGN